MLLLIVAMLASAAPVSADGRDKAPPHAEPESCDTLGTTRESIDHRLADDGDRRGLRVLMLLDGVTIANARQVVEETRPAYEPLGIDLTARYRPVKLQLEDGVRDVGRFIDEAKRLVGGRRPTGVDLVYLITTRDMVGRGFANCIGGVAFDTLAFAVGEAGAGPPEITAGNPVPVWPWGDGTAHTFGHEVGHLMGGLHELSNCVEGLLALADVPSPCSLMDPRIGTAMWFTTANAAVVRGHAVAYLEPTR